MELADLNETTRNGMVTEIDRDVASNELYRSPRLTDQGADVWADVLRAAAQNGNPETLARDIRIQNLLVATEQRRKPKGGFTQAKVPSNAPEMLGEGEFNRFYLRGLCLRAIEEGKRVEVYRAKPVSRPRPESEALIGKTFSPEDLLNDLRTNIGVDTALGLPSGPNSGLSGRLA